MITGTRDLDRVEAPVTVKAYLICAFAAFGGIFFGYGERAFQSSSGFEVISS